MSHLNKSTAHVPHSIDDTLSRVQLAEVSFAELCRAALQGARAESAQSVFTALYDESALAAATYADAQRSAGVALPGLAGLSITIKDLYDVKGEVTRSGSLVLRDAAPALEDACIVQRIRNAGMAIIGKTNMSEFAFSGVGINPHFGTPKNPCDPINHRIPGGSSSGAAVSVALGLSVAAIGSDTGGSIRIPAALCGLVGFKSTMRRVPVQGARELARSLDTVCAMTRSVADCLRIDAVLSNEHLAVKPKGVKGLRLVVAKNMMQDELETGVARSFERTLGLLSAQGADICELDFDELSEIAQINAPGGISPIESYAAYRTFVDNSPDSMDPRVVQRMLLGKGVSAQEYITLLDARRLWIDKMNALLEPFDALVSPTVALQAPKTQELIDSDDAFFRVNRLLLRNTFAINFLDGCAFSLPMHTPDELPMGLMLSSVNGDDARLAGVALGVEAVLRERSLQ